MQSDDWYKWAGGGVVAAIITWLRFRKKDNAETKKIQSETEIGFATVDSKKAQADVLISKVTLEWATKMSVQIDKLTEQNTQKQNELDKIKQDFYDYKNEAAAKIKELEDKLEDLQQELKKQLEVCKELTVEINKYRNGL